MQAHGSLPKSQNLTLETCSLFLQTLSPRLLPRRGYRLRTLLALCLLFWPLLAGSVVANVFSELLVRLCVVLSWHRNTPGTMVTAVCDADGCFFPA